MQRIGSELNALLPINSLPLELTIAILMASLGEEDLRGVLRIRELSSVQACWWDCIRTSPHFWTTLSIENRKCIPLKIRKSRHFPLTIYGGEAESLPSVQSFLEIVTPEKSRWGRLEFPGGQAEMLIPTLISAPLPLLRDVELLTVKRPPPSLDLCLAGATHLRRLSVNGFQVPQGLSRLTSLEISDLAHPHLSQTALQGILSMNPGLKTLRLQNLACNQVKAFLTTPLSLCELEELALSDLSSKMVQNLLSRLIAPRLCRVQIEIPFQDHEEELISDVLRSSNSSSIILSPLRLGNLSGVVITIAGYHLTITGRFIDMTSEFSLSLHGIYRYSWRTVLGNLATDFGFQTLNVPVELHINEETVIETIGSSMSFLEKLPTVTSITFDGCALDFVVNAIECLRAPQKSADPWPCPMLKSIVLDEALGWDWGEPRWTQVLESAAQVAEERAKANMASGGSLSFPELSFYQHKYTNNGYELLRVGDIRKLPQSR